MEHDPVTPLQNQWLALSLPNRLRFAKGSQDPSSNGGHPLLLVEHNSASKMDLGAGLMLDDVFLPFVVWKYKVAMHFFLRWQQYCWAKAKQRLWKGWINDLIEQKVICSRKDGTANTIWEVACMQKQAWELWVLPWYPNDFSCHGGTSQEAKHVSTTYVALCRRSQISDVIYFVYPSVKTCG